MIYYPISALINAITSFSLAIFVYAKNKSDTMHRTFSLFCLSIAFWNYAYFVWQICVDEKTALFWMRLLMVPAIFMPTTFFHYILEFVNIKRGIERTALKLSYILKVAFVPFCFTPFVVLQVSPKLFFKFWPTGGKLFPLVLIDFIVVFMYAYYVLYKEYLKSDGIRKQQCKISFYAITVAFIGGMPNWLLWYNIPIPPITHILLSVYVVMLSYGIVRYRVLGIEVIIKKTLIYSILISIITILYFIVIYILERIFSIMIGYQSIALAIIIIAFFSIIFIPLKNKIQRTIDRYFFKGTIDQIEQEKKLLEGELQKNERLKTVSTLAAGMAHEIKNPLTSIKTFAEYLEKKYNDPAFRSKFKNIVPKEIDKISKIINQLLDYSKVDKVSLKACNINSILDYVLDLYNNEFLKKHIKIQKSFNSQSPNITCDENQMKQAFINIVLNSIEAMPKGGELTIRTSDIDNILEVSIKDTGIGIPSDKLKYLFDPFYTTKQKGTGLGLFIVHQIIENNKGKIVIDTEMGKGTTIKIMFVR